MIIDNITLRILSKTRDDVNQKTGQHYQMWEVAANGDILNNVTSFPCIIFRFHIIGVNHINNWITIVKNCAKSGTIVVSADVNLVSAIIKQNAQNII